MDPTTENRLFEMERSSKAPVIKPMQKKRFTYEHLCRAVDHGLGRGQREGDQKRNEMTIVPQRLDALDRKGSMISVDAFNTQKAIAAPIVDVRADDTIALKDNHQTLKHEIQTLF